MEKFFIAQPEVTPKEPELSKKEQAEIERKKLLTQAREDQKDFEAHSEGFDMHEIIRAGAIERTEQLSGSANEVQLVKLKEDGWSVFKSQEGERKDLRADSIEAGTYYLREEAAYYVDQILGFGLVPITSIRDVGGKVGSIQQFVADSKGFMELDIKEHQKLNESGELFKLWIFDYIIWNSDRHINNLVVRDEKVYAIDNGLSFSDTAPSRVALDYFGVAVPEEIKTRLAELEIYLDSVDEAGRAIAEIIQERLALSITAEDAAKCIERIRLVAATVRERAVIPADFDGGAWKNKRFRQVRKTP